MMLEDPRDPSEFGGDSADPDAMDPGPQPVPTEPDSVPAEDDPSKDGSGAA